MNVEPDEIEQFVIAEFSHVDFPPDFENLPHKLRLGADEFIDTFFHGATTEELVDKNVFVLADAPSPVGCLVFDCRVPPAVEMDHMGCCGQIESRPSGLQGQNKKGVSSSSWNRRTSSRLLPTGVPP